MDATVRDFPDTMSSAFGLGTDFLVLGAVFAVFIVTAARLFPGIVQ
jgi:hypothetical protein